MFGITILGNNSALPAYDRHPTAQVVTLHDQLFLIDCGEGTQMQIARYKIRRSKINHIFISHLHGDHYFGLIGLLTSMGLLGREVDLHLYAPPPLKEIIQLQLDAASTTLPFILHFHALEDEGIIVQSTKFSVSCFKTKHRISCWGFVFKEKKSPRKLDKEKAIQHEVPASYFDSLKEGADYLKKDGTLIKNEWVTFANTSAKSYAYCADTIYDEGIVPHIKDATVIYHETTYLKDLHERAMARFHSTTEQAATIAAKANAEKLLIGHFSSKYDKLDSFLAETKAVFDNSFLAIEGVTFRV